MAEASGPHDQRKTEAAGAHNQGMTEVTGPHDRRIKAAGTRETTVTETKGGKELR
jgi:hypothetical protein